MTKKNIPSAKDLTVIQHFPIEWIKLQPRKVEEILSTLSLEEKAKHVLSLPAVFQRELLVLCEDAVEVTQSIPAEEIYHLILKNHSLYLQQKKCGLKEYLKN